MAMNKVYRALANENRIITEEDVKEISNFKFNKFQMDMMLEDLNAEDESTTE